jgi:hypothetical protein
MGLLEHAAYYGCFLGTAVSCAFLMAPSVYHRIHWRRDVRDKELMLRTSNRLAIIGVAVLALAMNAAVFLLSALLLGSSLAALITLPIAATFGWLWFGLPIARRGRDKGNGR